VISRIFVSKSDFMKATEAIRFAGLIGVVASLFGLGSVLAATFLAEGTFSWNRNALSDIGVSAVSVAANVFNISLTLTGILNFVFALGFTKANAKNALFYIGGILLMLGGISLSLVGVFTEAYGRLHFYVSTSYFSLFSVAIILNGFAFRKARRATMGDISILAGLIAAFVILIGVVVEWHTWLGLGFAVPELIASIIFAAWTVWMGSSLLVTKS
jgi:hypothetical membrane protein